MLHLNGHDFVQVFVDGKYIGKIDRVKNERSLPLPATKRGQQLTLLVEAMGRINFGRAIKDFKGLTGDVTLTGRVDDDEVTWNLKNWRMRRIADDYQTALRAMNTRDEQADASRNPSPQIGYYRATFNLKKTGDTFLNMETWGKGQV